MMRKFSLVALAFCTMVFCVALAGCAQKAPTDQFVNEWELIYGSSDDLDSESVDLAKSLGNTVILTLNEDGTGTLDLYGEVSNLTWAVTDENEGTVTVDNSSTATMKIEEGNLVITDTKDASLTFSPPQG